MGERLRHAQVEEDHGRLGRGGLPRPDREHGARARQRDALLRPSELRAVHPLPRGNGLALAPARQDRQGLWREGRRGQRAPDRPPDGDEDHLRARGRRRHARQELHREIPRRLRRAGPGLTLEAALFYIFAVGVLVAGAQVIFRRNPIYGALSLVGCFFFLAGIYVLLAAHLIAILQIMVYAGAVMVLFVFVIMLLNLKEEELGEQRLTAWKGIGLGAVLVGTAVIAWKALGPAYAGAPHRDNAQLIAGFGNVKSVGRILYLASVLPFEVTSLLLLVAVAAVVVAKGKI